MANKFVPEHDVLMRELKEMEELLSRKQAFNRNVSERPSKRFPRFTISTEMSCRSMFGEISNSANSSKAPVLVESN